MDFWADQYGTADNQQQQSGMAQSGSNNAGLGGEILTLPEVVVTPGTTLSTRAQQGGVLGVILATPVAITVGRMITSLAIEESTALLAEGALVAGIGVLPEGALAALTIGLSAGAPIVLGGLTLGAIYYYVHDQP